MAATIRKDRVKTILDMENGAPKHEEKTEVIEEIITPKKEPLLTNVETSMLALVVVGTTGITTAVNLGKDISFGKKLRNVSIAFISSAAAATILIFVLRLVFGKKTDKGVLSLVRDRK